MKPAIQTICDQMARSHHGVICRSDVLAAGGSKDFIQRRLRAGEWEKLHPGIYADASVPTTFEQKVLAAVRWVGAGAVASGPTAARLLKIPGPSSRLIHITTAIGKARRCEGVAVHRTKVLDPIDVGIVKGIPVTSPARTLLDICVKATEATLDLAFDDVIRRQLASPARLRWFVQCRCRSGVAGASQFRRMMALRPRGYRCTDSGLEMKFLRQLRKRRLPEPTRQYPINVAGLRLRADFAYPELKLLIEVDSFKYHGGRQHWLHDGRKRNAVGSEGWTILVATEDDIETGSTEVLNALERFFGRLLDL